MRGPNYRPFTENDINSLVAKQQDYDAICRVSLEEQKELFGLMMRLPSFEDERVETRKNRAKMSILHCNKEIHKNPRLLQLIRKKCGDEKCWFFFDLNDVQMYAGYHASNKKLADSMNELYDWFCENEEEMMREVNPC